jgi:amino acid transporter
MKLISKIFMALAFLVLLPIYSNAALAVSTTPVKPTVSKTEYRKALKTYKSDVKGMNAKSKRKYIIDKITNNNAKTYRLPLLLSSIGLLLTGALIIFLAYTTIGYLGFIIGVIGIIALTVWLIFSEGEKL